MNKESLCTSPLGDLALVPKANGDEPVNSIGQSTFVISNATNSSG